MHKHGFFTFIVSLLTISTVMAADYATEKTGYGKTNTDCGSNYMQPDTTARMGSHSFVILGLDGPKHLLLDHRSGTPPHNYHFILRVKASPLEIATYKKLLRKTKVGLPAVTTIDFDKDGKQLGRTFFCLQDLHKIFGPEKSRSNLFKKLFPIRATWQLNANYEGRFNIRKTIVDEPKMIIERGDVEIIYYRYLPSYLNQKSFRRTVKHGGAAFTTRLRHGPKAFNEKPITAATHIPYSALFGSNRHKDGVCPSDYYLKRYGPAKTGHGFLILSAQGPNDVIATHLYDQTPHNFHTIIRLRLSNKDIALYKKLRGSNHTPVFFKTTNRFCMANIRTLVKNKKFSLKGQFFKGMSFSPFVLGQKAGNVSIKGSAIEVKVNRRLNSLLDPQIVARTIFNFVNIKDIAPNVVVETRYNSYWNFTGKPVPGYRSNTCLLTKKAARQIALVQNQVSKQGYSLLIFDCYRPKTAVASFVKWAQDLSNRKLKTIFYPGIPKKELVPKYISSRSGHSRGSTIDLTLIDKSVIANNLIGPLHFKESYEDCRKITAMKKTGQLNMGTSFDCFSPLSNTLNPKIPKQSLANRIILKTVMEKFGFKNYSKEWWHFSLNNEPFKNQYFDFEVY